MQDSPGIATFLFTDIEGSSRLWEREPERMGAALARHDAIIRGAVERHHGTVVKMLGDGVHAHFDDPLDAINAILEIQLTLVDPASTGGFPLKIRSGVHAGAVSMRNDDYFGSAVNRAARIMSSAHGGQVLVSRAVLDLVADRLPGEIELRDLGAVRLRDLTSPEHLYQVMHAKLRRDFPALRSLETTPNNLPQQLTSFVGRERELAEVKRALGTTRLLTLIGPGGIGKTRIGLHVAAEMMDEHPDGVWFVDLAPLTDAQLVPHALASVLGVVEEAGRPVTEAIVKYLKDRRELILLDNCEHLLHACADLATQILRNAPNVRILASSRELMHVAGETSFPVPTLSVPDVDRKVTAEALPHFEAAHLFIDRATAVKPAFRVTEQNAGAIADICRRLDGIPLAIELAAARVRALSVDAIAARLSDRFKLLAGGDQSALPRQQTLRALIDWSYDLLSDPEKALLRRLSVFAGGWTLEAAEEVAAGGVLDRGDVLDLQAHLVDKSLVALDADGDRYRMLETVREYAMEKLERGKSESVAKANVAADAGAARYGMLESVRAYAKERLDESGEADEVRDRHLAYYLQYAEDSRSRSRAVMPGDAKGDPLVRFDRERENLVVAHAWCDHARQRRAHGIATRQGHARTTASRAACSPSGIAWRPRPCGDPAPSRRTKFARACSSSWGSSSATWGATRTPSARCPKDCASTRRWAAARGSGRSCSRSAWRPSASATSLRRAATSSEPARSRASEATSTSSLPPSTISRRSTGWRATSSTPSRSTSVWWRSPASSTTAT